MFLLPSCTGENWILIAVGIHRQIRLRRLGGMLQGTCSIIPPNLRSLFVYQRQSNRSILLKQDFMTQKVTLEHWRSILAVTSTPHARFGWTCGKPLAVQENVVRVIQRAWNWT